MVPIPSVEFHDRCSHKADHIPIIISLSKAGSCMLGSLTQFCYVFCVSKPIMLIVVVIT